jgi:hypothetical protein
MGILKDALRAANRPEMTPEMKDILRLLNELQDCNLTNWEDEFVSDLHDRVTLYRGAAIISEAQGDVLDRLADKYDLVRA